MCNTTKNKIHFMVQIFQDNLFHNKGAKGPFCLVVLLENTCSIKSAFQEK